MIKVVMAGRETNGWGEKENFPIDDNLMKKLTELFDNKINKEWEDLGSPVWRMFYNLRNLSEGDKPIVQDFAGKVGFLQTNVALIGKHYDEGGYNDDIKNLLTEACDRYFKIIAPDIILLPIGFGTNGHTELPYLDILQGTEFFGKLLGQEPIALNNPDVLMYKLRFENCEKKGIDVYGCRHPQGLNCNPIIDKMKEIIAEKLKQHKK
jgi:hypothetical protein